MATYGQSCTINDGCDATKSLMCSYYNQTLYKCLCANFYFWSGTTCTAQYLGSPVTACSSTSQCRSDLGLYCSTNCVCNITHYWDTVALMCGELTKKSCFFLNNVIIKMKKKFENYSMDKRVHPPLVAERVTILKGWAVLAQRARVLRQLNFLMALLVVN